MASPFFRDMLSLSQPTDSELVDGLPVVQLTEDAELLNHLVPMLYPVCPVIPHSEDEVLYLLATCQKYDMVSIQSLIRSEVSRRPSPVQLEAFRIYAIASSKRLIPEMEKAARLTLNYPMTFETLEEGLPLFEDWALRDLLRFRKRCRDNIVSCLKSFLEDTASLKIWIGCPSVPRASRGGTAVQIEDVLPKWLRDLLAQIKNEILDPSSIHENYLSAISSHATCNFCLRIHATEGQRFCTVLENKLLQARNKESVVHEYGS
ncbi:hypothetical protein BGW80DRAFT_1293591 [Lactifluus volemus]|nr:hypothetical protein BGW80DRAFT_1293591 [Lactifluus volemus]